MDMTLFIVPIAVFIVCIFYWGLYGFCVFYIDGKHKDIKKPWKKAVYVSVLCGPFGLIIILVAKTIRMGGKLMERLHEWAIK